MMPVKTNLIKNRRNRIEVHGGIFMRYWCIYQRFYLDY